VDYSQHGESTVVSRIFDRIGMRSRHAVEFGAGDGWRLSNIRMFLEDGWQGTQWDSETWVTAENVNDLFAEYHVPEDVDLVSIDIDGNDYWVWRSLTWEPSVLLIEYNAYFEHGERVALEYDPDQEWDQTYAYSASLDAMCDLGEAKGYFLAAEVGCANLVFVQDEHAQRVPALPRASAGTGWRYWADRGPTSKRFVEVP
jgi:hypothetical protein